MKRTIRRGQGRESTRHLAGVHRLQGAHVQHQEEQAERPGAPGADEVLPPGSAPHPAPGDEIATPSVEAGTGRGVAQLVEHWSPKPAVAGSSPVAPARPKVARSHRSIKNTHRQSCTNRVWKPPRLLPGELG